MNKRNIFISLFTILLLAIIFYLIWAPESGEKKMIELESTKEEVLKEVQAANEYAKKTAEWGEVNGGDVSYFNPPVEHNSDRDPKEDIVKYFLAGLYANDVDIFLSSFFPETISRDLFKSKNPNKDEVTREIMTKITRNGKLDSIEYGIRKGAWNQDSNTLTLDITYKDGKEAKIVIDTVPLTDSHGDHENDHSIFYITTSAWEIVRQIESST